MTADEGIRCMLMRGGTSKGAFFVAGDVPDDAAERAELLLRVMGSPDPRQIDGLGGAHPLTSKVAVVSASDDSDVDIDYHFLQVAVDAPVVSDAQTCGNLLAGVGAFAVERGLISAHGELATVRIRLINTGDLATARFRLRDGMPHYDGELAIEGVPGTAAGVELRIGGGRPLLPTGNTSDTVAGHSATLIDNGMPVVLLRAAEFGVAGDEPPAELETRSDLCDSVEHVRLTAGPMMGLGDVLTQTVPKVFLLSPPRNGGVVGTRAFIPHRVHTSIGVLMAASVAAGVSIPEAVGSEMSQLPDSTEYDIEHPGGKSSVNVEVSRASDGSWRGTSTSIRTARKIFDGRVFARPRL
ncbi:PrpF domain-containing protein [Nesterenkonia haasae]|uniref:PrpF domain-containing protein n=1 Tax=Nesterenkonia haasae TaxID=2587813 RepID=UPI001391BA92|nr:PrpF domain-containing protein [Nesterenkonia haasae]NDK31926.1 4-oxalomesaconate tautomerase [Nesterenkonia haasae]